MREGIPFVGASGKELNRMLNEAMILRTDCFLTNVFLERPPDNKIDEWCTSKKEADTRWQADGNEGKYPYSYLQRGKCLFHELMPEIDRLKAELIEVNPNVIVCLGNTPLWALTQTSGITKLRGTALPVDLGTGKLYKVIPTYHPAYILRRYEHRPVTVADLIKVERESHFPEIRRPSRELWIEPTVPDIADFMYDYLVEAPVMAWDIETIPNAGIITCIGFGTTTHAISIPFFDGRKENGSYWETHAEEVEAWGMVKVMLELLNDKLTQNGMYDMQWMWKKMGMTPRGEFHDTMLLHHSMFPEMEKSLGFLGSIYTNETAWKELRPKHRTEGKKDE